MFHECKNIEDVKVGDMIISGEGKIQKVYDVFSREYNDNIFNEKHLYHYAK